MPHEKRIVCVIPARYGSQRFPGKPLAELGGKPLVQWVYERASKAALVHQVVVATDDERIVKAVENFGGTAVLTSPDHPSGTDRIAEAIKSMTCKTVVNIQGDEPLIEPETIDLVIKALLDDSCCDVTTAMVRLKSEKDYLSPSVVKVITDNKGYALYFSRSPIPSRARIKEMDKDQDFWGFKHLGIYVYRKEVVTEFSRLKPGFLEELERLEQLRLLEHCYGIKVIEVPYDSIGVDTPADLEMVKKIIATQKFED